MSEQRDLFERDVLPKFEQYRSDWLAEARAVAFALGERNAEVTIDDVRRLCPPPSGVDPRVMGAVFRQRDGWRKLRDRRSGRRACHNRPIVIWTLRP